MAAGDVNTPVASAARTANGNSGAGIASGGSDELGVLVHVSAASGTSPSLVVGVEWSFDGSTWASADPVENFTAFTAAGAKARVVKVRAPYYRLVWSISGTTPSFTFSVQTYHT